MFIIAWLSLGISDPYNVWSARFRGWGITRMRSSTVQNTIAWMMHPTRYGYTNIPKTISFKALNTWAFNRIASKYLLDILTFKQSLRSGAMRESEKQQTDCWVSQMPVQALWMFSGSDKQQERKTDCTPDGDYWVIYAHHPLLLAQNSVKHTHKHRAAFTQGLQDSTQEHCTQRGTQILDGHNSWHCMQGLIKSSSVTDCSTGENVPVRAALKAFFITVKLQKVIYKNI